MTHRFDSEVSLHSWLLWPTVCRALLHTAFFCVEAAAVASADAIFRLISPFGSKARTIVSVPEECITLFKIQSYFLVCTLLSLSFSI